MYVAKPKSSRNSSVEAFVVAQGFRLPTGFARDSLSRLDPPDYSAAVPMSGAELLIVPFVACGDLSGYDADTNYPLKPLDDLLPASALGADERPNAAPPPGHSHATAAEYTYREAVQKPTTPAYRAYLETCGGARKLVLDEPRAAPTAAVSVQPPAMLGPSSGPAEQQRSVAH